MYYDKKAKENVEKLVVHCDKLDAVLFICHDESGCHLGVNKTVSKITSKYYFPNIIEHVRIINNLNLRTPAWYEGQ